MLQSLNQPLKMEQRGIAFKPVHKMEHLKILNKSKRSKERRTDETKQIDKRK